MVASCHVKDALSVMTMLFFGDQKETKTDRRFNMISRAKKYVALLNGSSRDKEFADFAGNKGFTYDPIYFDTTAAISMSL